MTYEQFKNKYNGKYIDYDGAYGYQCWDLAQYYNVEVLNVPDWVLSGCGNVKNMLWQPKRSDLDQYFDEVDTRAMQQGDVCIWEDNHIAIFDYYNPSNNQCYYFSQNPNPCQVMPINMNGHHAFRRKGEKPTPVITPNVPRDTSKNQIEVLIDNLNVRTQPSGDSIGFASKGYYNYFEKYQKDINDYMWYRIADSQWIASEEGDWTRDLPKQEPTTPPTTPPEEYIKLKIKDRKDGNVLVDVPMWIKE